MAITKREFAAKLLFWLLPWPLSKALPRSLRIYYFGPGAEPPSGWYDFYGVPVFFNPDVPPLDDFIEDPPVEEPPWWPPDAPPLDEFIEDPPVDPPPWWPIDPYNPPPPDQFPDIPDGPINPSDPYSPGPGPMPSPPQPNPNYPYFDDTWWEPVNNPPLLGEWDAVNKEWDSTWSFAVQWVDLIPLSNWECGFVANGIVFKATGADITKIVIYDTGGNKMLNQADPISYVYYYMDWSNHLDIDHVQWYNSDNEEFSITDIRFF